MSSVSRARARVAPGVSSGGQFAAEAKTEPEFAGLKATASTTSPSPIIGLVATNEQMVIAHTGDLSEVTRYEDPAGNRADVLDNGDGTFSVSRDLSDDQAWRCDDVAAERLNIKIEETIHASRAHNAAFAAGLDYRGHAFEVTDVNRDEDGNWELEYRAEDSGEHYTARWSEQDGLKISAGDGLDMTADAPTVAEDILGQTNGNAEQFFQDAEAEWAQGQFAGPVSPVVSAEPTQLSLTPDQVSGLDELIDMARRGREDFEEQAAYGDYNDEDLSAAESRWKRAQDAIEALTTQTKN